MDGLILPDLPYEEKGEFDPLCKQYGLDLVSLIAPTSHDRIRMIAREAEGFVYCVSSLGVTGVRSSITTDIGAMVQLVKEGTRYSVRGRVRHLDARAGGRNGREIRRRDRWLGDCEAVCAVRRGLRAACRSICAGNDASRS